MAKFIDQPRPRPRRWHVFALALFALAFALSGCRVTTSGLGVSHSATAASTTAGAGPGSSGGAASAANGDGKTLPGTILRLNAKLHGLTIDQAKRRLRELGSVGRVFIDKELHFIEGCGPNTVCWVEPDDVGLPFDVRFHVNPKLTISAPPP